MKGIGKEPIYTVSNLKGRTRNLQDNKVVKNFDGQLNNENAIGNKTQGMSVGGTDIDKKQGGLASNQNHLGLLNDSGDSGVSGDAMSNRGYDSHRGLMERDNNMQYFDRDDQYENESNKTDQVDDGTMNVFGFNDDLNLDDRLIILNPTDNQIYNLVERPKYLMSFELKDSEQQFLYSISK